MLCGLALLTPSSAAEAEKPAHAAQPAAYAVKLPSRELLEFLATFEDASGRWQDPLLFDHPAAIRNRWPGREIGRDR